MSFIFSAEIESIQKYVVTSNRMWTIKAGSFILDRFNEEIKEEFKQNKINGGRLIYSSAGSVKARFDERGPAEEYGKKIAKRLRDETEIASLTWAVEEIKDNNLSSALKNVEKRIQKKRSRKNPVSIINHPLFYNCEICKSYPATSKRKKGEKHFLVCHPCKLKFDSESRFLPIYNELNQQSNEKRRLFDDFDNLVKDDYLALICSDGNRLGEHLIELSGERQPENLLEDFSEKLNSATHKAFMETVNDVFKDSFEKDKEHFPFMVIILGGDDMSVAMPAKYAFEFTKVFTEKFTEKTKDFLQNNLPYVTISSGIAIAKHTFPFSNLYEIAEELLSNAKKLSRWIREKNKGGEYSTMDFEIITESLSEEIRERRRSLNFVEYIATGRPYLLGEGNYSFKFEDLYEKVEKLKKEPVSNSFINSLYDVVKDPSTMKVELDIKLKRLYAKHEKIIGILDDYKETKENLEGKQSLPILDIAEAYNYIRG